MTSLASFLVTNLTVDFATQIWNPILSMMMSECGEGKSWTFSESIFEQRSLMNIRPLLWPQTEPWVSWTKEWGKLQGGCSCRAGKEIISGMWKQLRAPLSLLVVPKRIWGSPVLQRTQTKWNCEARLVKEVAKNAKKVNLGPVRWVEASTSITRILNVLSFKNNKMRPIKQWRSHPVYP